MSSAARTAAALCGVGIKDANVQVGVVEDLADLVADSFVDVLHVELGCQGLLNSIDNGQLAHSLLDRCAQSSVLGDKCIYI
jgi:hypothetical protein